MTTPRIAVLLVAASLSAVPTLVGCDRDKTLNEQQKTTTTPDGQQTTSESKTVQHSDGSITQEKHIGSTPATNP